MAFESKVRGDWNHPPLKTDTHVNKEDGIHTCVRGANSRAQHGTPGCRGIDMQRGNGACPLGGVYGGGGDDKQEVTLGQKHYGGRGGPPHLRL